MSYFITSKNKLQNILSKLQLGSLVIKNKL